MNELDRFMSKVDKSTSDSTYDLQVGRWMREERDRLGLTHAALVNAVLSMGIHWSTNTNIRLEKGRRALTSEEAFALAALGYDLAGIHEAFRLSRPPGPTSVDVETRRMAQTLGVGSEWLHARCMERWGRPFPEERDARARKRASGRPGPLTGYRRHASRSLLGELSEVIGAARERERRQRATIDV